MISQKATKLCLGFGFLIASQSLAAGDTMEKPLTPERRAYQERVLKAGVAQIRDKYNIHESDHSKILSAAEQLIDAKCEKDCGWMSETMQKDAQKVQQLQRGLRDLR